MGWAIKSTAKIERVPICQLIWERKGKAEFSNSEESACISFKLPEYHVNDAWGKSR